MTLAKWKRVIPVGFDGIVEGTDDLIVNVMSFIERSFKQKPKELTLLCSQQYEHRRASYISSPLVRASPSWEVALLQCAKERKREKTLWPPW
jgi:hypothetical protein